MKSIFKRQREARLRRMAAEIATYRGADFNYTQAQEVYNWLTGASSQYETARQHMSPPEPFWANWSEDAKKHWGVGPYAIEETEQAKEQSYPSPDTPAQDVQDCP